MQSEFHGNVVCRGVALVSCTSSPLGLRNSCAILYGTGSRKPNNGKSREGARYEDCATLAQFSRGTRGGELLA